MPASPDISIPRALLLLEKGILTESHGLLPWGSNYTFLMSIQDDELESHAIYKPRKGERPLWDFPDGTLCTREVAAFLVSEMLGWHIVPPTILRDGPHGEGMVQLYVTHDSEKHYFTFDSTAKDQLRQIALFDHVINNADRKGGHCLLDDQGRIWAIDHGIGFHYQEKLRTVIWDFAGSKIAKDLVNDLEAFCTQLAGADKDTEKLKEHISPREFVALQERVSRLAKTQTYPLPSSGRSYPWPPV